MSAITASTQLKITLPDRLLERVRVKSEELGLKPTSYIRHLIISALQQSTTIPTYQMTPEREEFVKEQLREHQQGKTHEIMDIDTFMASL